MAGRALSTAALAHEAGRPERELLDLLDLGLLPDALESWCIPLGLSAEALSKLQNYPAAQSLPKGVHLLITPFGHLGVNAWWIEQAGVLVDTGTDGESVVRQLREINATPREIWITHGHQDHIAGLGAIRRHFPAITLRGPATLSGVEILRPGDEISGFEVIDLDGHWPGAIGFHGAGLCCVGDAIFAGSIGKIPAEKWHSGLLRLRQLMEALDDSCLLLPGHGPHSHVAIEKRHSPLFAAHK